MDIMRLNNKKQANISISNERAKNIHIPRLEIQTQSIIVTLDKELNIDEYERTYKLLSEQMKPRRVILMQPYMKPMFIIENL